MTQQKRGRMLACGLFAAIVVCPVATFAQIAEIDDAEIFEDSIKLDVNGFTQFQMHTKTGVAEYAVDCESGATFSRATTRQTKEWKKQRRFSAAIEHFVCQKTTKQ
jgi:hypothetical protein